MCYRDVVNQIVARLPTNINNVSESYLDTLIKRYVTKQDDIDQIKQSIKDMKSSKKIKTYKDFITKNKEFFK
ncbi:hypothetical protein QI334_11080 [Staphylococcus saprophyticus]|uniref:hypothetical protein n=1 Tax=Staphylococcus saprophyticus TaxID=29385 RepID=UPI0008532A3D|nr:hypothetical protein [Staphylococcus saprophyticus]MDW3871096.1 hypothetical protein [Staphylococcus saprophyticus]MDW3915644.1 hypothetical protein [Staphylococcus saprophyticus]MDW3960260.1 hypothetical protein [Staphylococcus saprophyticus]MDW4010805.1 hypothetical protein [Staphylococcus saprophyticus]MDW4015885.1 hypothetical protein [Staphylococcus saprophyticus]